MRATWFFLALLSGIYVLKESLQLLRRWFAQRTTSRIEGDMTVVSSAICSKVDLGTFAPDRVGSLHGRITRSVEGFVKFLRVSLHRFRSRGAGGRFSRSRQAFGPNGGLVWSCWGSCLRRS